MMTGLERGAPPQEEGADGVIVNLCLCHVSIAAGQGRTRIYWYVSSVDDKGEPEAAKPFRFFPCEVEDPEKKGINGGFSSGAGCARLPHKIVPPGLEDVPRVEYDGRSRSESLLPSRPPHHLPEIVHAGGPEQGHQDLRHVAEAPREEMVGPISLSQPLKDLLRGCRAGLDVDRGHDVVGCAGEPLRGELDEPLVDEAAEPPAHRLRGVAHLLSDPGDGLPGVPAQGVDDLPVQGLEQLVQVLALPGVSPHG